MSKFNPFNYLEKGVKAVKKGVKKGAKGSYKLVAHPKRFYNDNIKKK